MPDLGAVEYVFFDKSGTLTTNHLDIKTIATSSRFYQSAIGFFPEDLGSKNHITSEMVTDPEGMTLGNYSANMISELNGGISHQVNLQGLDEEDGKYEEYDSEVFSEKTQKNYEFGHEFDFESKKMRQNPFTSNYENGANSPRGHHDDLPLTTNNVEIDIMNTPKKNQNQMIDSNNSKPPAPSRIALPEVDIDFAKPNNEIDFSEHFQNGEQNLMKLLQLVTLCHNSNRIATLQSKNSKNINAPRGKEATTLQKDEYACNLIEEKSLLNLGKTFGYTFEGRKVVSSDQCILRYAVKDPSGLESTWDIISMNFITSDRDRFSI